MDDRVLEASLREAGLRLVGWADATAVLIPPMLATFAGSSTSVDGAFGDAVSLGDRNLLAMSNEVWFRLAIDSKLFGVQDRQFLLAVDRGDAGDRLQWAIVELAESWDIAGVGAASTVLGYRSGRPAFVMISLSGEVVLRCDVGEVSIDFSVVPDSRQSPTLRRRAEYLVESTAVDAETRAGAWRWLRSLDTEPSA